MGRIKGCKSIAANGTAVVRGPRRHRCNIPTLTSNPVKRLHEGLTILTLPFRKHLSRGIKEFLYGTGTIWIVEQLLEVSAEILNWCGILRFVFLFWRYTERTNEILH